MLLLIKYTLLYGIVLMLVALGGMFSEHSGIINIALEGIMVIGGVAGVLTLTMLPADMSPFLVVLISVLVAALAGIVYSLLLAFASINLKADQTIGGTALNLLATAIAVVIAKYFSDSGSAKLNYSNKPFLFSIGGLELSIFGAVGHRAARHQLCGAVQDPLRSAPARLRRTSSGSRFCGHQRLQDALRGCAAFRCAGRYRRSGIYRAPGADLEL